MKLEFLGKEAPMFDDVCYVWELSNDIRNYYISITFCGGIDEEGNQNLYNSLNAEISVREVDHRMFYDNCEKQVGILKEVVDIIGDDMEIDYKNSNVNGEDFSTVNESSFDDSIAALNKIITTMVAVMLMRDNPIEP